MSTGMTLEVHALVSSPATGAKVPLFLGGMVLARGLSALVLWPWAQRPPQAVAAGLLHATSISIPVVAGLLGVHLGLIPPENHAVLVAAGIVSVVVFPAVSLRMLRPREP